jgi:hypothetical protein
MPRPWQFDDVILDIILNALSSSMAPSPMHYTNGASLSASNIVGLSTNGYLDNLCDHNYFKHIIDHGYIPSFQLS